MINDFKMTNTQERLLDIFKSNKVGVGHILKPQVIMSKTRSWDRRALDEAQGAINGLVDEGYISTNGDFFVLEQKGYDHIYAGYSILDTERMIMDVFRRHKIGVGQMIMSNSFLELERSMERFHFDNYNQAFQNLGRKGMIEFVERGYKLTQIGYDAIY